MKKDKEEFNILTKIMDHIYVFIGFIFTCVILWDRLIRIRLPRIIPYNLTELSFILLFSTCIIFLIILIVLFFGIEPKSNMITLLPLKSMMHFTQYMISLYKEEKNMKGTMIEWLYKNKEIVRYIFMFTKILRAIMICLLAYEVFILHQIKIFYIFFPCLLLPFLFNYFIFFLSNLYEEQLTYIDERLHIHHSIKTPEECVDYMDYVVNYYKEIRAREWIQRMAWAALKLVDKGYRVSLSLNKSLSVDLSSEIQRNILLRQKYNKDLMQKVKYIAANNVELYCILYYFNETKNKYYTILNVIIILLYFITWVYILIKSFHTLKDMPITLKILEILAPYFSDMNPFTKP